MTENKKNDGPSCACGKVDLYEEFLKNEAKKKEEADAIEGAETDSETTINSTDKEE